MLKKKKSCRKVAEQLVAKPIAKLCLADKALSFKWRYDRCGCHSNLSNCKLSSPFLPKNNNNNNKGFSTRFKHMNSRSVLALNYSTNGFPSLNFLREKSCEVGQFVDFFLIRERNKTQTSRLCEPGKWRHDRGSRHLHSKVSTICY